MTVVRFDIHARWIDGNVYVRKADLLAWFDLEAKAHRDEELDDEAAVIESIATSLRKVSAA